MGNVRRFARRSLNFGSACLPPHQFRGHRRRLVIHVESRYTLLLCLQLVVRISLPDLGNLMLQMRLVIPHRDRDVILNGRRRGGSRCVRVPDQFKLSRLFVGRPRILHRLPDSNRQILCNDIRLFNRNDFELCITDKARLLTSLCAQMTSLGWVRCGFLEDPLTCTRVNGEYAPIAIVFPIKHHFSKA